MGSIHVVLLTTAAVTPTVPFLIRLVTVLVNITGAIACSVLLRLLHLARRRTGCEDKVTMA